MAYQTRGRDPLFDSDVQAAIEKRGKELLGLVLIVLGCAAAAMVMSYNPADPSFLSATDAPVQNWMGRMGATIAAPLFMIAGWGSLAIALVLMAWGLRFALHVGEERAMGRLIFAPIAVALCSVYAATLVPGAVWKDTHHFGLGGVFGDMIMGMLLTAVPLGSTVGIKLASLVLAIAMLALGAFVLGFTRTELKRIGRFLLVGMILTYARLMQVMGRSASGTVQMAQGLQARVAERRLIRTREAEDAMAWAQTQADLAPSVQPAAMPQAARGSLVARRNDVPPAPAAPTHWHEDETWQDQVETYEQPAGPVGKIKTGLLSRVPGFGRRAEAMPLPELVETYPSMEHEPHDLMPGDDRIRAKIADVIKSRVRPVAPMAPAQHAPLTRGRGRGPDPLVLNPARPTGLKAEPPLTAAHKSAVAASATVAVGTAAMMQAPAAWSQEAEDHKANIFDDAYDPAHDAGFDAVEESDDESWAFQAYQAEGQPAPQPMPIPVAQPRTVVQHPPRKSVQPSTRARAEAQPRLKFDEDDAAYELPPLSLLSNPALIQRHHLSDEALEQNARMLESVLDDYGVKGDIVSVRPGPVVTMYELEPAPGLKASRVIGLADDIARSMSALSARVSTVPGRTVIGIELPNENREKVVLREILSARDYGDSNMKLPLALGKDIGGDPIVANLAKMPHLLIAGTTGSGKSVAINTMILSLLYRLTPEECRLIMIDPKMLELSVYDGIPHLLSPVVTDPKKAVVALKWVVGEMEERYRKMSKMGVRNIDGYNSRVADALARGEMFSRTVQTGFDDETGEPVFETEELMPEKMPYIVVIVDEMADLMMVAGKEIEACIQRLAQMARASGIHLIMATQRPSVDVITGTIKANFPTRISFQVTSKIDSRTILGEMGAEQLLGMGDMLYMAGGAKITRCHGPFVSDEEVEEVVNHLKAFGPPEYMNSVLDGPDEDREADIDAVLGLASGGNTDLEDALYDTAVAIVVKDRKCSTSYIQRKLAIGYNKAARLVEQMEDEGVVSPANHVGKREVLVPER
ncbi:DNA translocase FtsK 4TM domain-containing protein [Seohaeicola saemankumensis]|uniref:DNA translocase FtsK n=1 Tax=Seohaeicola saemankumensis TaxID=481181 RepID=A0ABW3TE16_9RHOB